MERLKKIIWIASTLLYVFSLNGQKDDHRNLSILTDKPYAVAGERVWFSVQSKNGYFDKQPPVLHAVITDRSLNVILHEKIKTDTSTAVGYFRLPFELYTDNYPMIFYTSTESNNIIEYGAVIFPVIGRNELTYPRDKVLELKKVYPQKLSGKESNGLRIAADLNSDFLTPGEKVELTIETYNIAGEPIPANLNITVLNRSFFSEYVQSDISEGPVHPVNYSGKVETDPYALPEEGINTTFILDTEHPDRYAYSLSALTSIGNPPIFSPYYVSQDGKIRYTELEFNGTREFNLHIFYNDPKNIEVQQESRACILPGNIKVPSFHWTDGMKQYTKYYVMKNLIDHSYGLDARDTLRQIIPSKSPGFNSPSPTHYPADEIRWLENYTPFYDMAEVIREIHLNVRLRIEKGETDIVLMDKESDLTENGKPSFIIDGILTFNKDEILEFPVEQVASVEAIHSPGKTELFGPFGRAGVLAVYTKSGQYFPKKAGLYKVKIDGYQIPDQWAGRNIKENVPDIREVLLWKPNFKTNTEGQARISFTTGDLEGEYIIIIKGVCGSGYGHWVSSFRVSSS